MDGKTDIQFGATRGIADNIRKYSQEEDGIFNDFNAAMDRMTAEGSFEGTASDALKASANTLKGKFDEYVEMVAGFAAAISGAADQEEALNKERESAVDQLPS